MRSGLYARRRCGASRSWTMTASSWASCPSAISPWRATRSRRSATSAPRRLTYRGGNTYAQPNPRRVPLAGLAHDHRGAAGELYGSARAGDGGDCPGGDCPGKHAEHGHVSGRPVSVVRRRRGHALLLGVDPGWGRAAAPAPGPASRGRVPGGTLSALRRWFDNALLLGLGPGRARGCCAAAPAAAAPAFLRWRDPHTEAGHGP